MLLPLSSEIESLEGHVDDGDEDDRGIRSRVRGGHNGGECLLKWQDHDPRCQECSGVSRRGGFVEQVIRFLC